MEFDHPPLIIWISACPQQKLKHRLTTSQCRLMREGLDHAHPQIQDQHPPSNKSLTTASRLLDSSRDRRVRPCSSLENAAHDRGVRPCISLQSISMPAFNRAFTTVSRSLAAAHIVGFFQISLSHHFDCPAQCIAQQFPLISK